MEEQQSNVSYSPFTQAWRRLKKNWTAFGGLIYIIVACIIAILGYLITPDSTPFANDQILELETKPPGFSIQILNVRKNREAEEVNLLEKMIFGEKNPYNAVPVLDYHFDGDQIKVRRYIGGASKSEPDSFELANVANALSLDSTDIHFDGKKVTYHDIHGEKHTVSVEKLKQKVEEELITTKTFLLGSDKYGRDILSRLIIGVRVSLSIGFIVAFMSLLIGIVIGSIGGFFRGWIDEVVMWLINVVWSIPALLLIFSLVLVLGNNFLNVFLAIALAMWVQVARIIRGQIMELRELEFIEASRALGYGSFRIIVRHTLPNVLGPVMVIAAANFANAILIEAGLSFLGIGVQPPVPSWGNMINQHQDYLIHKPMLPIIPGIAIMFTVLAFYLLGNGLRDAFDVRSQ